MPVKAKDSNNFTRTISCRQWQAMQPAPNWTLLESDCDADKTMIGYPFAANAARGATNTGAGDVHRAGGVTVNNVFTVVVPPSKLVKTILIVPGQNGTITCTQTGNAGVTGVFVEVVRQAIPLIVDYVCYEQAIVQFDFSGLGGSSEIYVYFL